MDFQAAWLAFANFSYHLPLDRAPLPLPDPASNLLVPSRGPHSLPKHFQYYRAGEVAQESAQVPSVHMALRGEEQDYIIYTYGTILL